MKFQRCRTEEVQVSITPLIDVVFLLLIFFMVTTTFMENSRITVNLPVADAKSQPIDSEIRIAITRHGQIFVNDQPMANTSALLSRLQVMQTKNTHPNVVISADAKTTHQVVVTVMQAVGAAGLDHFSIQTMQPKSP